MADHSTLWVRSGVTTDGTYAVEMNLGEDRAWMLTREQAIAHAVTVAQRGSEAEHDTAVFRLLAERSSAEIAVSVLGKDIRPDRPVDHSATEPIHLVPCVAEHGPFVRIDVDGQAVGQVSPADCFRHATAVLRVVAVVDLDAALHRTLIGPFGLDRATARSVVAGLADYWPEEQS